jgi:TonB family protein
MTSLRLFETDGAAAEHATSQLFDTPPHSERHRASGWPYATSVVLHTMVIISLVVLGRYLVQPPRPAPSPPIPRLTHAFVFTGFGGDNNRRRVAHSTRHSKDMPVAIFGDAALAPLPPARGDSPAPDTSSIVDEKPPQPAFDPPIPAGDSRMVGRRGDPSEAGLGSATANVRGLPTGEIRSGGLGEGSVRNVRTGSSAFEARPGLEDTPGGGGASPPRIEEPLPIPDYPAAARTHRLQGVVVLEVMLDSLGKAHVRGVLSEPLGFGIEEAATNAAEKLKFTPARQGSRSVDAIVQVRVTFTLAGGVATAVRGGA